jgi:hypothetical protein
MLLRHKLQVEQIQQQFLALLLVHDLAGLGQEIIHLPQRRGHHVLATIHFPQARLVQDQAAA